ncbi:MAG: hypothetical protein HY907_00555 [Deltaproteobacteria bacterium]|nr:hypothetical protein [Deltaproteobacteria bacterium]
MPNRLDARRPSSRSRLRRLLPPLLALPLACQTAPVTPAGPVTPPVERWTAPAGSAAFEDPPPVALEPDPPVDVPLPIVAPSEPGDRVEGGLQLTLLGQLTLAAGSRAALRVVVERSTSILDAEPAAGAYVWLALGAGAEARTLFHGRTGDAGTADVNFRVPRLPPGESLLVLHVRDAAGGGQCTYARTATIVDAVRVLLTTDKPLYQPGQTLHARALAMAPSGTGARAGLPVTFQVEDAKGNTIFRKTAATSAEGIVALDVPLAERLNEGGWSVALLDQEGATLAGKTVRVERYVLPKFDVAVETDRDWYLPGGLVTATVHVRYFFGLPVANARVAVSAKAFDAGFHVIADVSGETDADGTFAFRVPLPEVLAGSDLEGGDARVTLETTVTDAAGQDETDTSSFLVAQDPISLLVMPESGALVPGVDNVLWLAAARPDGTPVTGVATLDLDGGSVSAPTDELGITALRFAAERPDGAELPARDVNGTILLNARFTSALGESVEKDVTIESRPDGGDQVLLRLDRAIARAGYPVGLEVLATRAAGTAFVDIVQDHRTVLTKALELHDGRATWEPALPPDLAGTIELHAWLLGRDGTFVRDGRVMVVEPADELQVAIEADKDEYLPGERALLRFEVTDVAGRPKSAALGVILVDEAVYALQEMQPGLEKIYFLLEEDVLRPRVELHFAPGGVTVEDAVKARRPPEGKQRAAAILLAGAEPAPVYDLREVASARRAEFRERRLPVLYDALERGIGLLGVERLRRDGDPTRLESDALETLVTDGLLGEGDMASPMGGTIVAEDLENLAGGLSVDDLGRRAARWGILHLYQLAEMWARMKAEWCAGDLGRDGAEWYCVPENILSLLPHTKAPGEAARVGLAEEEALVDPWGREYVARVDRAAEVPVGPIGDLPGLEILSKGPDGILDTSDDVRFDSSESPQGPSTVSGEYARWAALAPQPDPWHALTSRESEWSARIDELVYGRAERRERARERRLLESEYGDAYGVGGLGVWGTGEGGGGYYPFAFRMADAGVMGHGYGVGDGVGFGRGGGGMGRGRDGSRSGPDLAASPTAGPAAPRVREFFPETLLWNPELITDEQGRAQLDVELADSITSWRLSVLAGSADGALGSTDQAVRVFQPFFVDLDLPVALTQNDEVAVPVALYNYLDEPQEVALELERASWFEPATDRRKTVHLEPHEVTSHRFRIRARTPGAHTLAVFAEGTGRADAVRRPIRVEPDGFPVEQNISDWLQGELTRSFTVPADAIPGSESLDIKVYPGAVAQAVENLDSLLRVPSGCFEQTSSTTYPNVLVLDYLGRIGSITPEVRMKAEQYIQLGYQRLLTFEIPGGGFEWFGNPPANTVLTAYGLREFVDMARVYPVDPDLIERTRRFLLDRQEDDGSWTVESGGFQDGAINRQQGSDVNTTAYVAWSLAAGGWEGEALTRARGWLARRIDSTEDPYSLALLLQVFAGDADGGRRDAVVRKLAERKRTDESGGAYWAGDEASAFGSRGSAAAIETTALVAAALAEFGQEQALAQAALDWLVRRKDVLGNWDSTQATILALRALLAASSGGARDLTATVEVIVNGTSLRTIEITPETSDVLHFVDGTAALRAGENTVTVASSLAGRSGLMAQLTARSFVPWSAAPAPPSAGPLELTVSYDRTELAAGDTIRAGVSLRYRAAQAAENAMVDLGVPPGFDVVVEDLDCAVREGTIARYELTGRQIVLYVLRLESGDALHLDVGFRARYPLRARSPASDAWLYYQPEVRATAAPVAITVVD